MKYRTKVVKWGNSLYLPFPKVIAETTGAGKDDSIEVEVEVCGDNSNTSA